MGLDWLLIWRGLAAFLTGGNPYASPGYYYPPAFTLLAAPLALLPEIVGYLLLVVLTAALCFRVYGKRFVLWLTFVPVLYGLVVGNVDLLFVALGLLVRPTRKGAFLLALLTLKPQLALILLPALLLKNRVVWKWFALFTALLWGLPALLLPALTRAWFAGVTSGAFGHGAATSAGLWSLGLPLALALGVMVIALARRPTPTVMTLLSPLGQWNGLVVLTDAAPLWLLSPVSLIALYASGTTGAAFWWTLIPLVAFGWQISREPLPFHRLLRNYA